MPLKTRITLLVMASVVALWAVFVAVLLQREQDLTLRYHDSLQQAQAIAWTKLQSESLAALQDASQRLLAQPGWERAWREQDRPALSALLENILDRRSYWRADLFDSRRTLVYSSSTELKQDSLVDAGWVSRAMASAQPETGLSQVSRQSYYLAVVRRFGEGPNAGILAIGLDVSTLLPELAQTLASDSFLLNLRGREVAGTLPGLLAQQGVSIPLRQGGVNEFVGVEGQRWLATLQPLAGPDRRQVGALLSLRDVSVQHAQDRRTALLAFAGVMVMALILASLVFIYLRRALQPLERSVGVLGALSKGDMQATLDEADEELPDESGQIARGVAALRDELLKLQMVRDERARTRQQQERLIRRQLKLLAESLDEASRAEILAALEPVAAAPEAKPVAENELAGLASILGRMSGLVTTQQDRLVGLLKELRAAMQQQALLVSLQQELEIARRMQLSILPRSAPDTAAVAVTALMIPAKEVGGDFYDYFLVDERFLAVVVADVSGKGIPAAFFMAISRTLLKSNALFLSDPAQVIAKLNGQLCAENEQLMFVTVFFGVLDLTTGVLNFVNAGHNPPVLRTAHGDVSLLPGGQNMALAVMEDIPYEAGQLTLAVGDMLLLYTDGVTEASNFGGELFGDARLLAAMRNAPSQIQDVPSSLLRAIRGFENGAPQADDITCVAISYQGPT